MSDFLRAKMPALPAAVEGLAELAVNLSWSWHREARALFRTVDEVLWHQTRHNPIRFLREVDPARLEALAASEAFTSELDRIMAWMAGERTNEYTWFGQKWPEASSSTGSTVSCASRSAARSAPSRACRLAIRPLIRIVTADVISRPSSATARNVASS